MRYTDVRLAHEFFVARGKYVLLRRVCDVLVHLHVRTTPHVSTTDTFNEIIQEQIRRGVRVCEQRCHTLKTRYERIGKELLHDDEESTTHQATQDPR